MARKKKLTIDKYNYGSYVIMNQQNPNAAIQDANFGKSALSGATTGASALSFLGPMGTIAGGVIGAVGGLFSASSKERKLRRIKVDNNNRINNNFESQFNSLTDVVNENPYGTYAEGGDVTPITEINIEKGELQVDPETGKIIREYTGINPETGGLYEPHNNKGKDTKNNIVTAEQGTFIITKDKAKEYKDAIDNNDKLHQNTIMHNIRNKKRQSMKFAKGGLVDPVVNLFPSIDEQAIESLRRPTQTSNQLSGIISNDNAITQSDVNSNKKLTFNDPNRAVSSLSTTQSNINWGNIAGNVANYLPGIINTFQGMSTPDYMSNSFSPINPYRNQILTNLPQNINYTPLLNRIYRDRNTAYGVINETTNSPAIARANKLNVMANTQRGIQDTYFQGEEYNNRVRGQRAGIYDSLGQQELARFDADRRFNFGVDMTNRQMAEGRRQQLNYGLSQLHQMYQNNKTNQQLQDRDSMRTRILEQIFPALLPYLDDIYGIGGTNGSR